MRATDHWCVLGSGTLDFHPQRGPSCHLLTAGGSRALVDSGPGTIDRLGQLGLTTGDLRAIVHSHRHLDHLADLFPLLFHRALAARDATLLLAGARGHEPFVRGACAALYDKPLLAGVTFLEQGHDGGATDVIPGVRLRCFPAVHSQSPRLLRFEAASWSLCYSGDTGPGASFAQAADAVDWLVVECTAPDGVPRGRHLAPRDVAEAVRSSRPKAVALVHLSPAWAEPDEAAEAVRALLGPDAPPVIAARDGTVLPLPFSSAVLRPHSHSMVPGGLLEMS